MNNTLLEYFEDNFSENFEKLDTIRESESGKVELYRHNKTGKKLIKIESENRNENVLRKLIGVKNENLPEIYDVCSGKNRITVLEEYIEGVTLSKKAEIYSLSKPDVIRYAIDICSALSVLHGLNIVHRDVKPENVIIDASGKAVLIDLGISRFVTGTKKRDTNKLGTVNYAAPEQFGATESTFATDVYAVGTLINYLITGVYPSVRTPGAILGIIVRKCTSTQIYNRYQNVNILKKYLELVLKFKLY